MGAVPSGRAFSWLPTIPTSIAPVAENVLVQPVPGRCGLPSIPVATLPAGGVMGEGLMPVPEKIRRKIVNLEFVEMRDLMPESWLRDDEEVAKNVLSLPRRKSAPMTNILLWVQCFAGIVGVFSTQYAQVVPELMAYMATIVKCSRDFEGVAWAQYDGAYRRQMAQTKDLRWSRLNPTLFSLCFAGKAKRNIVCSHCLSDNHVSDSCPDNPSRMALQWQIGAGCPTQQQYHQVPQVQQWKSSKQTKICYMFNKRSKDHTPRAPGGVIDSNLMVSVGVASINRKGRQD